MDTRTGEIVRGAMLEKLRADANQRQFLKQMEIHPTPAQMRRRPPRVGRNELCPCGSGKKFKKCCLVRE